MTGPTEGEDSPVPWTAGPVSRRAEITPEREAVLDVGRDRTWSYRAYDDLVRSYVEVIRAHDATTIAVLSPPSIAVAALSLAAFRGACRLGMLHRPDEESQHVAKLDRLDADLLICAPETQSTALSVTDGGETCPVVTVGEQPEGSLEWVAGERPAGRDSEVPAEVVLFTSGTTGDPKGVRLTVANCVASAVGSAFRLGVDSAQRWLAPLSMAHTGGLLPVYRCALYGTTVVLAGPFDREDTAATIADRRITTVSLVPTMLERLLEDGWEPPAHLGAVLLGGAPASDDLIERCERGGIPVYPTYGATEAASQITTATPAEAFENVGTVGRPLLFTDLEILDDAGQSCPPGEAGEIVVSGPSVTPGYLDRAVTDRAFDERGRFHTRDRGYRDAAGRLWVTGRLDNRILTGGEVVPAGRVESAIGSIDGVESVAVVGIPDAEWGERVGALVVPASAGLTTDAIQAHCRDSLAEYERPKTLALVEALPRTASGTVDRDAVLERLADAPAE